MKTETIVWNRPDASIEITISGENSFFVTMKQNGKRTENFSAGLIHRTSSNPMFRGLPGAVVAMIGGPTVCLTQPKLDEVMQVVGRVETANHEEKLLNQEFGRLEYALLNAQEAIRTRMDSEHSDNPAVLYERERLAHEALSTWKASHPAFWRAEMERRATEKKRHDDEAAQTLIGRGLD